jgi:hypothetical protein
MKRIGSKTFFVWVACLLMLCFIGFQILKYQEGQNVLRVHYIDFTSKTSDSFGPNSQLKALIDGNPEADAESAFKSKDKRFVAVMSIGPILPGIESFQKTNQSFVNACEMKEVDGTTDFSQSPLTDQVNAAAFKYATRYNIRLLRLLSEQN